MTELMEKLAADVGGRYVVERELGRGGMATVYLARDLLDERRVAIKVMDPELSAAVGAERFKREIAVASRLEHPNILGIIASGEAAGTSYYVMPFVQGESLRDRLSRETQLPVEDAIRIAREVAGALDYAHQQGVIHRDIKPENILLEDGRALVADFGIARAASADDNSTLTKTGTALGTPHYMSPEQVMGEKKDIDGRTDQYALGCMLYEMLAGQPPFVGPHAQSLMAQHVLDDPPFVTRFRTSTPSNVEDAILTTLAKNKQDRFPTMRDFTVALENTGYTSLMKITRLQRAATASQLTALKPPMPAWKRAVIAAAALVLVGGGTAATWAMINDRGNSLSTPEEIARARRVAVTFFEPGDDAMRPVADGLTTALIGRLATVAGLSVVSANGVLPFRGSELGADSIGRALDVGTVVRGRVVEDGKDVRIELHLFDSREGLEIGRGTSIRVPAAVLATAGDSVAKRVAERLQKHIGGEVELAESRGGTGNTLAWTSLQRAAAMGTRADSLALASDTSAAAATYDRADSLARVATAADARWTAPHVRRARLAIVRAELLRTNPTLARSWLDSAIVFANAALAIDPKDADAYEVRGEAGVTRFIRGFAGDRTAARGVLDAARKDLESATAINASQAGALELLSRFAYSEYNVSQAKNYAAAAYRADAWMRSADNLIFRLFITSHDANDYPEAQRWCAEGFSRFPEDVKFARCRLLLLTMKQSDPAPSRVWPLIDSITAFSPPARRAYNRHEAQYFGAAAFVRASLPDSARHMLVRLRDGTDVDPDGHLAGYEAFVRVLLGEKDEAVAIIEAYVAKHPAHLGGFKRADFWWWQPLQDHPGFQRITRLGE